MYHGITVAALLTAAASGQSLITNGGFEAGAAVPSNGFLPSDPGSGHLPGWTITRGQIDVVVDSLLPASEGLRLVDLNGSPGSGGVLQSFATVPGERYLVRFDLWRNTYNGLPIANLRVEVDGTVTDFVSQGNDGWTSRAVDFVASGSSADLELYSLDPPSTFGPLLDDIQVFDASGSSSCVAVPNSTGHAAEIHAVGTAVVANDDLRLLTVNLPDSSFGYYLLSRDPGHVPGAGGGEGTLCLGGTIGRFNMLTQNSGGRGEIVIDVDLGAVPQPTGTTAVAPGDTWYFQLWYRDATPNTTSNFSNATQVQFS